MPDTFQARMAPDFADVIGRYASPEVDAAPSAAYGLWKDGIIAYVNQAWFSFARANDGAEIADRWGLGANIWDAIEAPLREFYQQGFSQCVETHEPWAHTYQCPGPTLWRTYLMLAYPLAAGDGFLIVNSLQSEVPHPQRAHEFIASVYVDEHGMVKQCMHCRRVRRSDGSAWDWVPALVREQYNNLTGGLCRPCLTHHYPGATPP